MKLPFRTYSQEDTLSEKQGSEILLRVDPQGNLLFLNDFAQQYFGCGDETVIGRNIIGTLMPDTDAAKRDFYTHLEDINSNAKQYYVNESQVARKNGDLVWIQWKSRTIRDDRGNLIEIFSVGNDVTERKILKEQILHSQKMEVIGRLTSGIAHDFNNIMIIINGYSERLLNRIIDTAKIYDDVEQINKAGKRAMSLCQQLLNFGNAHIAEPKMLDLNEIITDIEAMLQRLLGKDLNLITRFCTERKMVKGNAGRLGQVVMNLALNACDAMPDGGTLTICTEHVILEENDCAGIVGSYPGNFICLSIEDTGAGMEDSIIKDIFTPFFSTKGPTRGTGLGLAVVKDIISEHKGWINVYSQVNKGTLFKIYLPAFSVEREEESAEPKSFSDLKGSGERVLIIEDEEGVRDLVTTILQEYGYTAFQADTAESALALFELEQGNFHMVLCDVNLPGKCGLQLVSGFLAQKPDIKILMSSGHAEDRPRIKTIRDNGYLFLKKPYTIFELLKIIKDNLP